MYNLNELEHENLRLFLELFLFVSIINLFPSSYNEQHRASMAWRRPDPTLRVLPEQGVGVRQRVVPALLEEVYPHLRGSGVKRKLRHQIYRDQKRQLWEQSLRQAREDPNRQEWDRD